MKNKHTMPKVMMNKDSDDYIVTADLFYGGTLLKAGIIVDEKGTLKIEPYSMLMSATSSFGGL